MLAVGIDVSKSKSTVAIIRSDGSIVFKPHDFSHTISDIEQLTTLIHSYQEESKIALESTSHYHYPILKALLEEDFSVFVINPFLVKKFMDNSMRKGKTDKKDAVRIARFVLEKSYQLKPYSPTDQKYDDLKFLSRQYSQSISLLRPGRHLQLVPVLQITFIQLTVISGKHNLGPTTDYRLQQFLMIKSSAQLQRRSVLDLNLFQPNGHFCQCFRKLIPIPDRIGCFPAINIFLPATFLCQPESMALHGPHCKVPGLLHWGLRLSCKGILIDLSGIWRICKPVLQLLKAFRILNNPEEIYHITVKVIHCFDPGRGLCEKDSPSPKEWIQITVVL